MSSEVVAESSVNCNVAVAMEEAGKQRGRLPVGQVTAKLDVDSRLQPWSKLSSEMFISKWLDMLAERSKSS